MNVTLTVHVPCAASNVPQVFVCAYSLGVVIEVIVTAVGCLLLTVTVFAALVAFSASFPKPKLAGVTLTGTTPFPVSDTVCGLLLALSVMVSVELSAPRIVGVNITLMLQFAPAANKVPQAFVWL